MIDKLTSQRGQHRTVVRFTQIKNRIRKKRFFVTQKNSFCQFFLRTLVLKAKSAKSDNKFYCRQSRRCESVDFEPLT